MNKQISLQEALKQQLSSPLYQNSKNKLLYAVFIENNKTFALSFTKDKIKEYNKKYKVTNVLGSFPYVELRRFK